MWGCACLLTRLKSGADSTFHGNYQRTTKFLKNYILLSLEKQGVPLEVLTGTTQNDMLKEYQADAPIKDLHNSQ